MTQPRETRINGASALQLSDRDHGSLVDGNLTKVWKRVIVIVAMMPLVQTICTWDNDGLFTAFGQYVRQYSIPTVALEILVLLICTSAGWQPGKRLAELPRVTKLLILATIAAVMISSLAMSSHWVTSVHFAVRYVIHISVFFALVHILSQTQKYENAAFCIWAMFYGALAYVAALSAFAIFAPKPENFIWWQRMPSATNIRQIGNVVALLALAPVALLMFERHLQKALLAWAGLICLLTFIMWTGSRGALLSICLGIGFAGWLYRATITAPRTVLLVSAALIAIAISICLPSPDPNFGLIRMAESVTASDVSSGRVQVWQNTFDAIRQAPFFGHGAGMYRQNMADINGFPFNHPHNFILQFVYDWGVVGGGLMVTLFVGFGIKLVSSSCGEPNLRFLSTSAFVTLTGGALIDGPLFYPLPIVIAAVFMCLLVSYWNAPPERQYRDTEFSH